MERAIDSLTYEGSISDAILEAKAQKKLFAVYISWEDESWLKWEQSTFGHPSVAEFISKYCIFLHLKWGSLGASQFSAIYPQKTVPSISVVGYTGVLLWHESCYMGEGEGYVDARDIVNSIHKAWATLHPQETTATVSETARGPECQDSSISDDQLNPSEKLTEHSEHRQLADPNNSVDESLCEMGDDHKDTIQGKEKCTESDVKQDRLEQSDSANEASKEVPSSVGSDVNHPGDFSLEPQVTMPSDGSLKKTSETTEMVMANCSLGSSQIIANQVEGRIEYKKDDNQPVICTDGDVSLEPQGNIPSDESHNNASETAEAAIVNYCLGSSEIITNQVEERIEDKKDDNHPVMCTDGAVSLESQRSIPSDESHNMTSETAEVVMANCSLGSSQIITNQVEERIEDKKDDNHPVMCTDGAVSLEPQRSIPSDESHNKTSETAEVVMASCSLGSSQINTNQVEERSEAKEGGDLEGYSNATVSNDIHLHIRMPTGAMLQASFNMADTLRSVRNYIDENQTGGTSSYDLAVTYPRRVFSEQDMARPLSEMGWARRQSLLVVPRNRATGDPRGLSLIDCQYPASRAGSSNKDGGYFRHAKWILSYMNPFSYFRSDAAPNEPNPTIQNQLPRPDPSSLTIPANRQNPTPGDNANNPRGSASRPFGSNIHTLRQNEDEGPNADRNMFWNGNSTQYGGDEKK